MLSITINRNPHEEHVINNNKTEHTHDNNIINNYNLTHTLGTCYQSQYRVIQLNWNKFWPYYSGQEAPYEVR